MERRVRIGNHVCSMTAIAHWRDRVPFAIEDTASPRPRCAPRLRQAPSPRASTSRRRQARPSSSATATRSRRLARRGLLGLVFVRASDTRSGRCPTISGPGLDLVLVRINAGLYWVQGGHDFGRSCVLDTVPSVRETPADGIRTRVFSPPRAFVMVEGS